ncbi:MAG: ribosome biogenesis GTPase Der [Nitrospinota bacterium]
MIAHIVAIVGRPNVGKSTLFNRIAKKRIAIVDSTPGVTRDRNYIDITFGEKRFILVDTGGFEPVLTDRIPAQIREQAEMAIEEADAIILLADAKGGIASTDREIAETLRRSGKRVYLAINKVDTKKDEPLLYDYYDLGFDTIYPMSAEQGIGVETLLEAISADLPTIIEEEVSEDTIKVAVVGKPNAGKSTLVNSLIGSERMMVSDIAGTTRDSIDTLIEKDGARYLFIDTAGIRKRRKIDEKLEKYSVMMALRSIDRADIALLMVDASTGLTEQDVKIGKYIADAGKGCIIVVNKWDIAKSEGDTDMNEAKLMVAERMKILSYAPVIFISATSGFNQKKIYPTINRIIEKYRQKISTGRLNKFMEQAIRKNPPPSLKGKFFTFYYGTQVNSSPPSFILFVNNKKGFDTNYLRYLHNAMRTEFDLEGTPMKFVLKDKKDAREKGDNKERKVSKETQDSGDDKKVAPKKVFKETGGRKKIKKSKDDTKKPKTKDNKKKIFRGKK